MAFRPATFQEGVLSLAVEIYRNEVKSKVPPLIAKIETEMKRVAGEIAGCRQTIAHLNGILSRLSAVKPEMLSPLIKNILDLDKKSGPLDIRLKLLAEQEELLIQLYPLPYPEQRALRLLICVFSKAPLYDAIYIPSAMRVNAYALGCCYRGGKVQLAVTPWEAYQLFLNRISMKVLKEFFGVDSYESFLGKSERILSTFIRDFKTCELAHHFFPSDSQRRTFSRELLFDKVLGDLYDSPYLLPCGHTESASRAFTCNTSCQINYHPSEVSFHDVLQVFVNQYKKSCQTDILTDKIKHLKNLIQLGLRKDKETKQELNRLNEERQNARQIQQKGMEKFEILQRKKRELAVRKRHYEVQLKILNVKYETRKKQIEEWGEREKLIGTLKEHQGELARHEKSYSELSAELGRLKESLVTIHLQSPRWKQICCEVSLQYSRVINQCILIDKVRLAALKK